ncbi:MAG: circadian clock protein KaiC [Gemmatimonadetes bacterium]|nr:circadian clock protein KaiC [Gemmatimonadota bacterium]
MTETTSTAETRILTGVRGLDDILGGGLPVNHLYLLDGEPGTGKTTFALQFLLEGASRKEKCLYVTLSENKAELTGVSASHGWSLGDIDIFELSAASLASDEYTLFHPAEVELQETMQAVFAAIETHSPARVVFDSLSEMRLLARDPLRFRRQILALKQFFAGRQCTVLLLDDKSSPEGDLQLHSLAHGVIVLEHIAMDYGAERRRLQVTKLRGIRFWGGYHDFRILTGGIAVYPRIRSLPSTSDGAARDLKSGDRALDELLGGGLTLGTSTLVTGAAGTGKTTLALQYVTAAVNRGERACMYLFDERVTTFRMRAAGLGIDINGPVEDGRLRILQVDPTEMSPGEFANDVMRTVDEKGAQIIVLDSINGYMNAMPAERLLLVQIHELLSYLANKKVTSILTLVQHGVFGAPVDETAEVSYLADTVLLLRYFEFHGNVRQAMSVVKKRSGSHERTIREFQVAAGGVKVGEPLREFQGVLTGVPNYTGSPEPLLRANEQGRRRS